MYLTSNLRQEDLKFKDLQEHLKDHHLRQHYGDRFMMFATEDEAKAFANTQQHAWVSKIYDYNTNDLSYIKDVGVEIRKGAKRITKGWLVSLVGRRLSYSKYN
jgi:hypothetical protein